MANARRTGESDPSKAIFADMYKLLGNSPYGKFLEASERQALISCMTR